MSSAPLAPGSVSLRLSAGLASGTLHLFLAGSRHRELIVAGPLASDTCALEPSGAFSSKCTLAYTPTAISGGTHRLVATYNGQPIDAPLTGASTPRARSHPTSSATSARTGSTSPST